ncbi:MAG TPA: hypothetical protein VG297_24655 [Bryobacteraceae bacterium]|jgi:hypothetical protein|nr:hypothetical protein [Bryobacteraceae bacterium]
MATPVESANLILKLYELRREPVMREARNYFMTFDPRSVEEYMAGMMGPNSGHIRMVTSYWEMAASFVTSGAIDPAMFEASAGEHVLVFGKIEGILPQLRQMMDNPGALKNLEQVCTSAPGGLERVRAMTERIRGMMASRSAAAAR